MKEPRFRSLVPWILLPLIVSIFVLFTALESLPTDECGGGSLEDDRGGASMILIFLLAASAVGGAGLARLAQMKDEHQFDEADKRFGMTTLIVLAVMTGGCSIPLGFSTGFLIAAIVVAAFAFLLLVVAAVGTEKSVEEVGVLLPTYLFTLAFAVYPAIAVMLYTTGPWGLC